MSEESGSKTFKDQDQGPRIKNQDLDQGSSFTITFIQNIAQRSLQLSEQSWSRSRIKDQDHTQTLRMSLDYKLWKNFSLYLFFLNVVSFCLSFWQIFNWRQWQETIKEFSAGECSDKVYQARTSVSAPPWDDCIKSVWGLNHFIMCINLISSFPWTSKM